MVVTPSQMDLPARESAVTMARYAQKINASECAVLGVDNPNTPARYCRTIWTKDQRDTLNDYLLEAQLEIEQEVGFFLEPTWVVGQVSEQAEGDDRFVDNGIYAIPYVTRYGKLIAGGVRAETTIQSGAAVNHAADPAVIGPIATTVADEDEIKIFHPGTDIEMNPSLITIAGGNVTIEIPRCRTVTEAASDNPEDGLSYSQTGVGGPFEQTVDVKRVYNDPITNAVIVEPHTCNRTCTVSGCTEDTQTGCIYIRNARLGIVDILPATYAGGSWGRGSTCRCGGQLVRLNYYCGMEPTSRQAEDAIIRLAHTKMPTEICQCDPARQAWREDNLIPETLTRERVNCPFGLKNGAWIAWQFVDAMRLVRGGSPL